MSKTNKILAAISVVLMIIIIILLIIFFANRKPTYTVTFNTTGGTIIEAQKVKKNGKATRPANPTKTGYKFAEWKYNNQKYDFNTPVTKDIVLVAQWQSGDTTTDSDTITVRFDTDGGSTITRQVIKTGSKAIKPKDPTKKGYKFVEWTLEDKKFDFDTELTKNTTLKAKWETDGEKYTVTFNSDGGTKVANQIIEKGKKATKPANPTKNGYTFVEWTLDGKTYNFNSEVTKNITLKATWKATSSTTIDGNMNNNNNNNTYIVTFNSDGGSSVASQTVNKGGTVKRPPDPIKTGYTFKAWTLNGSVYDFNKSVNANMTLKATWQANDTTTKYTVTFNSDGGSSVASQTVNKGGKATRPANPTKSGYTFVAWTLNGSNYDFNQPVNGDITLVATWTINKTYTVVASKVDNYSPTRILSVRENGSAISFQAIYSNGVELCTSAYPNVDASELAGVSTLTVVLTDGSSVTATLVN